MSKKCIAIEYRFVPPRDVHKLEHFEIDIQRCLYNLLLGDNFSDLKLNIEKGTLHFTIRERNAIRVPNSFAVTSCELDHSKDGIPPIIRICETCFIRKFMIQKLDIAR